MEGIAGRIKGHRMAMLTTTAPDGTLISRPMALQAVEFDGDPWFYVERSSRKITHIAVNPQVNVTIAAWFPAGPESDGVVLLLVSGDSAQYWDTRGGRIASVVSLAKAKL